MLRYTTFGSGNSTEYRYVILVNKARKDLILKEHVIPLGLPLEETIAIELHQNPHKKNTPAAEMIQFVNEVLLEELQAIKAEYVFIANGPYLKTLCKVPKVDPTLGYKLESPYLPEMKCFYLPAAEMVFRDPDKVKEKINQVAVSFKMDSVGAYEDPGADVIEYAAYPQTVPEIKKWLEDLLEAKRDLACDIEAFSLKFNTAGIGTIAFSWSQGKGVCFPVDLLPTLHERAQVRALLIDFFERFENKLIFHNIGYDVTVLIYQLYMSDILDLEGLAKGMDVLLKNWEDTRIIAYLALNSCAGNELGLKTLSHEYAGNYAVEEIKSIIKIPLKDLLQYNVVDTFCTWYVYDKYYPKMVEEDQLDVYEQIFKPAMVDIIHMQLTGLPVDLERAKEVTAILQADNDRAINSILSSPLVQEFTHVLNQKWVDKRNSVLKKKRVTLDDASEVLNPNSGDQLISLLYEFCGLPVIDTTDSKLPATGGDTLKKLKNHTQDPTVLTLLNDLIDLKAVNKILTSTMPAILNAIAGPDGWHYLCGNFNLGGTVSGRLSSSGPNLN